jgi:hypothetical protein
LVVILIIFNIFNNVLIFLTSLSFLLFATHINENMLGDLMLSVILYIEILTTPDDG